jgi:hypothetical protein
LPILSHYKVQKNKNKEKVMSFSIAETLSTMNAGLSSTATAALDFSAQWGGWAVTAVHQGINTHVVGTISIFLLLQQVQIL